MWDMISAVSTAGASALTFVAVSFAAWQIKLSERQARVAFEDQMNQQYRSFTMALPVDILLGGLPEEDQAREVRELIFNYLDLANEQIYLRSQKRVFDQTWNNWRDGIASNLEKPAFKKIYDEVIEQSGFNYLKELVETEFRTDPIQFPKTR